MWGQSLSSQSRSSLCPWHTPNDGRGAFLLAYLVGFMFPDNGGGFFSAVALLGMSYWLIRLKTRDETLQPV